MPATTSKGGPPGATEDPKAKAATNSPSPCRVQPANAVMSDAPIEPETGNAPTIKPEAEMQPVPVDDPVLEDAVPDLAPLADADADDAMIDAAMGNSAVDAKPKTEADAIPADESKPVEEPKPAAEPKPAGPSADLKRVQRKWQMAAVVHFFSAFGRHLPIANVRAPNLPPLSGPYLERAIVEPDTCPDLCVAARDAIAILMLALRKVSVPRAPTHWFPALQTLSRARRAEFADCFDEESVSLLRAYPDGLRFLTDSPWPLRLATMHALVDTCAEEADCVRDALRAGGDAVCFDRAGAPELGDARLTPFGRCSKRRFYYRVSVERIYSGFKAKGDGLLEVECSDSDGMRALIERLERTRKPKDRMLASRIRDLYLPALEAEEEIVRRRLKRKNKLRELKMLQEDQKHVKMLRPRRKRVIYNFE